jgi:hypothetical protein
MTEEDKVAIRKVQRSLLQIQNTGKAPINLTQYQKMGLIAIRHKNVTMPSGRIERVLDRLILTDKGKRTLAVIV